jgi:hypothetical protein
MDNVGRAACTYFRPRPVQAPRPLWRIVVSVDVSFVGILRRLRRFLFLRFCKVAIVLLSPFYPIGEWTRPYFSGNPDLDPDLEMFTAAPEINPSDRAHNDLTLKQYPVKSVDWTELALSEPSKGLTALIRF